MERQRDKEFPHLRAGAFLLADAWVARGAGAEWLEQGVGGGKRSLAAGVALRRGHYGCLANYIHFQVFVIVTLWSS